MLIDKLDDLKGLIGDSQGPAHHVLGKRRLFGHEFYETKSGHKSGFAIGTLDDQVAQVMLIQVQRYLCFKMDARAGPLAAGDKSHETDPGRHFEIFHRESSRPAQNWVVDSEVQPFGTGGTVQVHHQVHAAGHAGFQNTGGVGGDAEITAEIQAEIDGELQRIQVYLEIQRDGEYLGCRIVGAGGHTRVVHRGYELLDCLYLLDLLVNYECQVTESFTERILHFEGVRVQDLGNLERAQPINQQILVLMFLGELGVDGREDLGLSGDGSVITVHQIDPGPVEVYPVDDVMFEPDGEIEDRSDGRVEEGYTELQRVRFGDRLQIGEEIGNHEYHVDDAQVLEIQDLVEVLRIEGQATAAEQVTSEQDARRSAGGQVDPGHGREDRQVHVQAVIAGRELEVAADIGYAPAKRQICTGTLPGLLPHTQLQRPYSGADEDVVRRGVDLEFELVQVEAEATVDPVERKVEIDAHVDLGLQADVRIELQTKIVEILTQGEIKTVDEMRRGYQVDLETGIGQHNGQVGMGLAANGRYPVDLQEFQQPEQRGSELIIDAEWDSVVLGQGFSRPQRWVEVVLNVVPHAEEIPHTQNAVERHIRPRNRRNKDAVVDDLAGTIHYRVRNQGLTLLDQLAPELVDPVGQEAIENQIEIREDPILNVGPVGEEDLYRIIAHRNGHIHRPAGVVDFHAYRLGQSDDAFHVQNRASLGGQRVGGHPILFQQDQAQLAVGQAQARLALAQECAHTAGADLDRGGAVRGRGAPLENEVAVQGYEPEDVKRYSRTFYLHDRFPVGEQHLDFGLTNGYGFVHRSPGGVDADLYRPAQGQDAFESRQLRCSLALQRVR